MPDLIHCPALIALELDPAQGLPRDRLSRDEAGELAVLLGDDLSRLLPGLDTSRLAVAAALYDQAQLLRPGWPIYTELADLADLADRAPAAQGRESLIIGFGADDSRMPTPCLQPEAGLGAGPILLLPWMLSGEASAMSTLGATMEQDFSLRGEVGAPLADFLIRRFGNSLQHARHMTRHDLCALACVQLEHVGLSALWQLLETALLSPQRDAEAISSRGRSWRYQHGQAVTATPDYADWLMSNGRALDASARAHAYAGSLFELRQYVALLDAHALPLELDPPLDAGLAIQTLAGPDAHESAPELIAHEAPGLGVVVYEVVQAQGQARRVLARAYPLRAGDPPRLQAELARRYALSAAAPRRLGRIALNADASALDASG